MVARSRILVIGPAWVGDMVMAQSLFIALRRDGAEVDVVAPQWSLPLLARMPEVHRAIALPVGHGNFGLLERWRIGRSLRAYHYDRAIVMPRSFKSALIPFFAGIPRRTGYRGEMRYGLLNDIRPLDKQLLPRVVDRYVALGLPMDAPLPPRDIPLPRLNVDVENRQRLIRQLDLDMARPAVAFMPGAEYGPAKRWPLPHYAALARELLASGRQVWILGSAKEQADGEAIVAAAPSVRNLCGMTRLEDTVDLLSLASAAVSNDSGLMHVAAATDVPLVALYGSSSPTYTPPLSHEARVLYLGLPCSPCFKRHCPLGDTPCLKDMTPPQVMSALQSIWESEDHA
ncbi:lipopolysaccharide heptosyltransferase II [Sulfurivermis fontis]|uniref:lipopolysaccharide heptosyltransferase II n=1 Tax=Sulfurivermis fontis TaxID=1972068 RepID=UPI000FD8A776|nr:lipopolysaccharide heptosyltransferase II [Sulfurivermis fontis]